jgi:hypothetical protein
MSYTHIHLPSLDNLKQSLESNPTLLEYYSKYDSWIGSIESVEYLTKALTKL